MGEFRSYYVGEMVQSMAEEKSNLINCPNAAKFFVSGRFLSFKHNS